MRLQTVALCGVLLACGKGAGAWKQTAPLPGGAGTRAIALLVDSDSVFAGTALGLAVTTDDGLTWKDSSSGLPMPGGQLTAVEALIDTGTKLLAGTDDGTFASTDHGASWTPAGTGLPGTVSPYAFWNAGAATLVGMNAGSQVAGMTGGVFRTTSSGASWSPSSTGLDPRAGVSSFAQLDTKVFAATVMAVARSTDDGQTWMTSASPANSNPLWLEVLDGTLYVATSSAGVFKTTDGIAFNAVNSGLPSGDIVSTLFAHAGALYAGTDAHGVFVTHNGGATWAGFSEGFTGTPRVVQLAVHGTKLFAATETAGVWARDL